MSLIYQQTLFKNIRLLDVSPHHLLLNDQACAFGDTNKKMNPPLRDESDRLALIEGLIDGIISLSRAAMLMTSGPAKILQKQHQIGTVLSSAASNNLCIVDLENKWQVDEKSLQGLSKNSAFLGMELQGKVMATFLRGNLRYLQGTGN